jgi:hypothetical protein
MNKKFALSSALFALACLVVLGSACKKDDRDRYVSREKGFSITVPPGWDIEEKKMNTDLIAVSPDEGMEDTFRENFNVLVEILPREMTIDEYYLKGMPIFKEFAKEFRQIASGVEEIDGAQFRYDVVSHKMGPLRIRVLQYLFVKDKKGYLITFSAADEKYDRYAGMFKEVAKGFRFE